MTNMDWSPVGKEDIPGDTRGGNTTNRNDVTNMLKDFVTNAKEAALVKGLDGKTDKQLANTASYIRKIITFNKLQVLVIKRGSELYLLKAENEGNNS